MVASHPRELWFWRLAWFLGLAAAVGATVPLARINGERVRHVQVREELRQLQHLLQEFRKRYGAWPTARNGEELISALRGHVDAQGRRTAVTSSFLVGSRFYFLNRKFEGPGAAIIDPWGRPYVYFYYYPTEGRGEDYVLFSPGPDGRFSSPLFWRAQRRDSAGEDADNVWIGPDGPPRTGRPGDSR